jgi:hypothetical protein
MNRFLKLIPVVCLLTGAAANADGNAPAKDEPKKEPASNDVAKTPKVTRDAISYYRTAEQIKAMPQCKATVVQRAPCYVVLKTAEGRSFHIGSPGNTPEIAYFLVSLKEGQTYNFPEVFLEYQKRNPAK